MNSILLDKLFVDGISEEDCLAVKKFWGSYSDLRLRGHISVLTFEAQKCNVFSIIQNGKKMENYNELDLDSPFLTLLDRDDNLAICYVSYE